MSSFNSMMALASVDMPLQDDAASTVVLNRAGTDGVATQNTSAITTTGPGGAWPKAINFNGTSDTIELLGDSLSACRNVSEISLVVQANGMGAFERIATFLENAAVSSRVFLEGFDTTYRSHVEAPDGTATGTHDSSAFSPTWEHVIATFDLTNDKMRFYLDGALDSEQTFSLAATATDDTDSQGAHLGSFNGTINYFGGDLAGFAVIPSFIDTAAKAAELVAGPELQPDHVYLGRDANCLAWFSGDANGDGTGDADDASGNDNGGTWSGTAAYADGVIAGGKAFSFGGSNYIVTPSEDELGIGLSESFSTTARVTPQSVTGKQVICEHGGSISGQVLYLDGDNVVFNCNRNGVSYSATASGVAVIGTPMSVVGVADRSGDVIIYVNGVAYIGSDFSAAELGAGTDAGAIGAVNGYAKFADGIEVDNVPGANAFTGTIEDILILDRALTADEVTAWSASTQPYYIDNGSSIDAQGNYDIGSFSLPSGYSGLNSLYWDTLAGNIIGAYPLSDNASSTTVANLVGVDATLIGGETTADLTATGYGAIASALELDGAADGLDEVSLGTLADSSGEVSVFMFVKMASAGNRFLFTSRNGVQTGVGCYVQLAINSNGSVSFYNGTAAATTAAGVFAFDDAFHSITFRADGSSASVSIDGTSYSFGQGVGTAGNPWYIGSSYSAGSQGSVTICGVSIYDSQISDTAEEWLRNNPLAEIPTLYESRLVNNSGSVLETAELGDSTTGTFATALAQGSTYHLEARATNDGGVDIGDSPAGTSPDGWYRVGSLAVPTYEELGTDADLYDWLPLNDNAATDTYANSGSTGEDFVAYAGNSEDHHVAFDGGEPFNWLTGGWFKNSGTSLRLRNSGSARTGTVTALSVCGWIKTTDPDGMIWCIDDGGDIHARFDLDTNGTLRVVLDDNASPTMRKFWTSTASDFDDGTERFVAFTWSAASNTLTVYGDDGVVIPGTLSEDGAVASIGLDDWHVIGGVISNAGGDAGFHHLADLREYHRELSQAEVQVLFAGPVTASGGDFAPTNIIQSIMTPIIQPSFTHRI